jgi:hypothetical protein
VSALLALPLFGIPFAALTYLLLRRISREVANSPLPEFQKGAVRRQLVAFALQVSAVLPFVLVAAVPRPLQVFPALSLVFLPGAYVGISSIRYGVALGGRPFRTGTAAKLAGATWILGAIAGAVATLAISPR